VFLISSVAVQAAPVLVEGFDNVAGLSGWTQINNSVPLGSTNWYQGETSVFSSHSGADDSYVAANFLNATLGGNVSNWLVTPIVTLADGDTISFYTRSTASGFQDRLEVRLNLLGNTNAGATDTSVGDFTELLLEINPSLDNSYPGDWTQYVISLSGLGGPTNATIGFRYLVTDTNSNGDYIGIDTLLIDSAAVPEPGTLGMFLGAFGLAFAVRRRRA